jgi:hypothetical protein
MELTLANLLYHFDWALPDGADPKALDMSEVFGITMRRRSNLCLQPSQFSDFCVGGFTKRRASGEPKSDPTFLID